MRTCGGVSVVRWRSDPPIPTIVVSSSGSVGIRIPNPESRIPSRSFNGLPHDLFDAGHAFFDFAKAAGAQRQHPLVDRLAPQFEPRGADENQLAQLLADFHHFVETDASLVA